MHYLNIMSVTLFVNMFSNPESFTNFRTNEDSSNHPCWNCVIQYSVFHFQHSLFITHSPIISCLTRVRHAPRLPKKYHTMDDNIYTDNKQ